MVWSGRADGWADYFNRRWLEEVGVPADELEGRGWTRFVHPDDLEEHMRRWQAAIESGDPAESHARIRRADGQYRWMLHRIQPVRDGLGNVIRWFGSSLEIEESKRTHETMRNTEHELRTILETIPAFVWTAQPDGALDFITESWVERMGHTRGQVLGGEWANMIHPEDRERLLTRWRGSIAQGCPLDAEMGGCDANGRYRWLLARAVALRDEAGAIIRWYGTLTDIDDRKWAERPERRTGVKSGLLLARSVSGRRSLPSGPDASRAMVIRLHQDPAGPLQHTFVARMNVQSWPSNEAS